MVKVRLLGVKKGLAEAYHGGGDHDLVRHLGVLTSARLAHMLHFLRVDI